jgi:hypothetical protein
MVGWKKPLNQPAKLAERVVASGDGEAEPGVTATDFQEPAKLATDRSEDLQLVCRFHLSPTSWAGTRVGFRSPGSASPSPGATTLSASFAG